MAFTSKLIICPARRRRFLAVTVGMVSFIASSIVPLLLVLSINKRFKPALNLELLHYNQECSGNSLTIILIPEARQSKKYSAVLLRGIQEVNHHTKK